MRVGKTIYLDHQATTPVDTRVSNKMQPFLSETFGNPHSMDHFLGWHASKAVEAARSQIAQLINAGNDEIIFTSGATESNNLALLGYARRYNGTRKRILLSSIEHKCVFTICDVLEEQYGYQVDKIPVDEHGVIDLGWLETNLDTDVLFVSVMAVNNEIGTIQPLMELGQLVANVGAFLHCDAAQAVCSTTLDVEKQNVDFMSLSAHKIYGPKGVGALFIRRSLQSSIEPVIYGGGQERNLRGGTVPAYLCVGMGIAAELYQGRLFLEEKTRVESLRDLFVQKVCSFSTSFKSNGPDFWNRHPGNANICFDGFVAQDILMALQPRLAASTGSACTSGIVEPSYVLKEIGLTTDKAAASIRFSLGRFSTSDDVNIATEYIFKALNSLR